MKSYTDIGQSKQLAEFLPLESADMFLAMNGILPVMSKYIDNGLVTADETAIPCWSLSALLDVLPKDIIVRETIYSINIHTKNKNWFIDYKCNNEEFIGSYSNIFIDACFKLIIKLHEQKLL